MKPEALARIAQDLRWRVGLLVFAVLGSVGGACALWALQDVRSSGARMAGRQAGALAQSVAQTLALQLGRAVHQGTPLQAQPAMASELAAALRRHAALAHLAVETHSGAVLHAVGDPPRAAAAHVVRTPIAAGERGARAGTVVVAVDAGHALQRPLRKLRWQAAVLWWPWWTAARRTWCLIFPRSTTSLAPACAWCSGGQAAQGRGRAAGAVRHAAACARGVRHQRLPGHPERRARPCGSIGAVLTIAIELIAVKTYWISAGGHFDHK